MGEVGSLDNGVYPVGGNIGGGVLHDFSKDRPGMIEGVAAFEIAGCGGLDGEEGGGLVVGVVDPGDGAGLDGGGDDLVEGFGGFFEADADSLQETFIPW